MESCTQAAVAFNSSGVDLGLVMSTITKRDRPASNLTVSDKVLRLRFVEIEDDRREVALSKLVRERFEECDPSTDESTEQQNALLSNGVNDVADLLVAQQQQVQMNCAISR